MHKEVRRNKTELEMAVLMACSSKSAGITAILYKTHINCSVIHKITKNLCKRGFLKIEENTKKAHFPTINHKKIPRHALSPNPHVCKRKFFSLTQQGKKVVEAYQTFLALYETSRRTRIIPATT